MRFGSDEGNQRPCPRWAKEPNDLVNSRGLRGVVVAMVEICCDPLNQCGGDFLALLRIGHERALIGHKREGCILVGDRQIRRKRLSRLLHRRRTRHLTHELRRHARHDHFSGSQG